jgi:DNA topoisomerase IB
MAEMDLLYKELNKINRDNTTVNYTAVAFRQWANELAALHKDNMTGTSARRKLLQK